MIDNTLGNSSADRYANVHEPTYRDWREERREWRQERREARLRHPFHGLFWGLFLILIGALFLSARQEWISGDRWWEYLLIGAGTLSIITGIVQYSSPYYRFGSYWRFITGFILILIGTLSILYFGQWWPLVLIVSGIALLLRFFWRK